MEHARAIQLKLRAWMKDLCLMLVKQCASGFLATPVYSSASIEIQTSQQEWVDNILNTDIHNFYD